MKKTLIIALAVAGLWAVVAARAQEAKTTLDAAATALGATSLKSIEFSGRGSDYMFGQAYDGNHAWPRFNVPSYTMTIASVTFNCSSVLAHVASLSAMPALISSQVFGRPPVVVSIKAGGLGEHS